MENKVKKRGRAGTNAGAIEREGEEEGAGGGGWSAMKKVEEEEVVADLNLSGGPLRA